MQSTVVEYLREKRFTREAMGEVDLYAQWATFLVSRGIEQDAAVRQASLLADASTMIFSTVAEDAPAPTTPVLRSVTVE